MGSAEAGLEDSFRPLVESRVRSVLSKVERILAKQGTEAYVVGGWVRDALLGRATADIDIALDGDALAIAPKVASALAGKSILLDEVNQVVRVVLLEKEEPPPKVQWHLDFSSFAGSIESDLTRRDFTINAMAINLRQLVRGRSAAQVIDPFHGRDDLRHKVIRAVTETVFAADPIRLLRAVRLAAELGFTVDRDTEALIQRDAHLIARVAGERVREELLRLLSLPGSGRFLPYLAQLGLLTAIFPELALTRGVVQPKEHAWDVLEHSLKTVAATDFLLHEGDWEYADASVLASVPWSAALSQHFDQEVSNGSPRKALLRLGGLLHDIAKPQTKAIEPDGRLRFLGHAQEGAIIAAKTLERLRFSIKEIRFVELLIRHHLRPGQMSQEGLPTRRAIYRYFRDTGDTGIDILFLSLADHLATRGPDLDSAHWQEHTGIVTYVLEQHSQEEPRPLKLVDGHDIINIFGISPGPEVGKLLEAVREAQAAGELATRKAALDLIKQLLKKQNSIEGKKG
jgi:poly(A) polymerase